MQAVAAGEIAHLKNGVEGYWELRFLPASETVEGMFAALDAMRAEIQKDGYQFPPLDLTATDRDSIYD
jgi:hypothetical protein